MATQTPWGKSQEVQKITRGINFYSTASHGGYRVSAKLNESMPEHLKLADGWYEEDCDWARVVLAFPQHFSQEQTYNAIANLKEWNWQAYEVHFNRELAPGESTKKDRELFERSIENKFQAVAAFGSWHKYAKPGHVVVIVANPTTGEEKTLLVPKADYDARKETYGIFVPTKNYEEI